MGRLFRTLGHCRSGMGPCVREWQPAALVTVRHRHRDHCPDGYRQLLVALSAVSAVAVLVAGVMRPGTWNNLTGLPPNFSISVGWDYGAIIALGAAVVSAGIGIAAIRDSAPQPRRY
jgi:hypothetical protein